MITQHMNQQSFADVLGISPASLSSIFNDRTKPTLNHIDAIKKKFPAINLDWLLYGRGPMFLDNASDIDLASMNSKSVTESVLNFEESSSTLSNNQVEKVRLDSPVQKEFYTKPENNVVKTIDCIQRKITEIRIFYDDQTWETFVPKK